MNDGANRMIRIKWVWLAFLTLTFIIFSTWYGGNGEPLTAEEGERLLAQFETVHGSSVSGEAHFVPNIRQMITRDDGKEFYAVNLEQLKSGDEALAADRAYARIVFPLLFKRAGHPVFVSQRAGLMLGDYGDQVDRVAVVRYRSLRDMIEMASEPSMAKGAALKFLSLDHTEVFVTRPTITFLQVRFVIALLLILLGFIGLKLISIFGRGDTQIEE